MANYVVCVDLEHAKIFELHPQGVEETTMKRHEVRHHTGHDKDKVSPHGTEKFFHEVAAHLKEANEILLIGPGLAKEHFKTHVEKHFHGTLAKKIVGLETVDHPTDGQIVALGKKFFKAHPAV